MKTIAAISGSNSSTSINTQLLHLAGSFVQRNKVEVVDLREFDAPIYSADIESNEGIPSNIQDLLAKMDEVDAFIFALPEHNGYMTAFFKNTVDWLSRANAKFLKDKPVLLLSTSPGKGGAKNGMEKTAKVFGYFSGDIKDMFSLPSFYDNFDGENKTIIDNDKLSELKERVERFDGMIE